MAKKDLWYDIIKPAGKRVAKDVKKAAKGSKEHQAGKASRKATKAERVRKRTEKYEARIAARKAKKAAPKKAGKKEGALAKTLRTWSPGKYAAKLIKGEPIGQSKKAAPKKAAPKKAAPQKFGKAFSSARKAGKKTFTWKGKSYTTKTADDTKKTKAAPKAKAKAAPKKAAPKAKAKAAPKKAAPTGAPGPATIEKPKKGEKSTLYRNKPKKAGEYTKHSTGPYPPREDQGPKFAQGGKVEASNPYGWPSRDARNGGKK